LELAHESEHGKTGALDALASLILDVVDAVADHDGGDARPNTERQEGKKSAD